MRKRLGFSKPTGNLELTNLRTVQTIFIGLRGSQNGYFRVKLVIGNLIREGRDGRRKNKQNLSVPRWQRDKTIPLVPY